MTGKRRLPIGVLAFSFVLVNLASAQTWSQLAVSGPAPGNTAAYATMGYDSTNDRLIAFFPEGGTVPAQVWVLTNANGLGGTPAWTQLQPTGTAPENNGGGTAVYDANANQLIVYGGCTANCGSPLPNVYVLTNANGLGGTPTWSQSTPSRSIPRTGQSAVYDPTSNSMITFGGNLAFPSTDQNDTNVLSPANASSPTWRTLTTSGGPPGVRILAGAGYDIAHNRMIIFGGLNEGTGIDYNDAWVLSNANGHGGTPIWTELLPQGSAPPPRRLHTAVYDRAGNNLYVFGGLSDQTQAALGDVWKLSDANGLGTTPPKWTQIGQLGTPPGGNLVQEAAFDPVNRRMISFGGEDRNFAVHFLTFILDLKQH